MTEAEYERYLAEAREWWGASRVSEGCTTLDLPSRGQISGRIWIPRYIDSIHDGLSWAAGRERDALEALFMGTYQRVIGGGVSKNIFMSVGANVDVRKNDTVKVFTITKEGSPIIIWHRPNNEGRSVEGRVSDVIELMERRGEGSNFLCSIRGTEEWCSYTGTEICYLLL